MLHRLTVVLSVIFGLSAFASANASKILNIELICDGEVDEEFKPKVTFGQSRWKPIGKKPFSYRFSIKNNIWKGQELQITETHIYLEKPTPVVIENGLALSNLKIDRLTGRMTFQTDQQTANGALIRRQGLLHCKKLDPEKKLF